MRALAGALLVLAGGHGLLRLVTGRRRWAFGLVGGTALSWLAGTATVGLLTTLLAVLGLPLTVPVAVALAALTVAGGLRSTRPRLTLPTPAGATVAVAGAWLLAAASRGRVVLNDEYAIWGLRGRALGLAGRLDERVFANAAAFYQHLDYPLLVPATIAWSDAMAGRVSDGAAKAYVAAFAVAPLGVVAWAAETLAGRAAATVAVLLALTVQGFGVQAVRLLADLPAAAFGLATVALLLVWLRDGDAALLRVAAVMAAGAWGTKNEGALFVVAAALPAAAAARIARRRLVAPLAVAGVAFLANVPWTLWTRAHDIRNDVVSGARADAGRLGRVARGIAEAWPAPALVTLLLVAGTAIAVRRGHAARAVAVGGALALTVAGLAATYVVTPYDLDWHLSTSANRVLLYPALLTAFAVPVLAAGTMRGDIGERERGGE